MLRRQHLSFTLPALFAMLFVITGCAAPAAPTTAPTAVPTAVPPTVPPTTAPTAAPTIAPTIAPTVAPTTAPTTAPTVAPTVAPTSAPSATATKAPTTAATTAPTSAGAGPAASGQPGTLIQVLPAGPGRDLLLNNCGSCHSPACPVIGQRDADHWNSVKANHKGRVTAMSDADYNALFDYLATNFNDKKPEPNLLPEIRQSATCAQF